MEALHGQPEGSFVVLDVVANNSSNTLLLCYVAAGGVVASVRLVEDKVSPSRSYRAGIQPSRMLDGWVASAVWARARVHTGAVQYAARVRQGS